MIVKLHQAIRSLVAAAQSNGQSFRVVENRPEAKRNYRPRFLVGSWFSYVPAILLSSGLVTLSLFGIKQSGHLQFLELVAYDQMVQMTPSDDQDPRLLLIGITEQDIKKQKQWPLSDQVIAQVLNTLQTYQPQVIGLDIYRDVPYKPGTEDLYKALQANNIVVVKQLPTDNDQGIVPLANIPPSRIGFSDFVIDPDNVVRRNLMYGESPSGKVQAVSFALQVSLKYLKNRGFNVSIKPESEALTIGNVPFTRLKVDSGGYHLPEKEAWGWQSLLKYRRPDLARQVTLQQVLDQELDPNWVKDKIVLIGVTASSEKDTFPTPYSAKQTNNFEMPGVMIHGQMVSQILGTILQGEQQLWFWSQWLEWLWVCGWALVGGVLVWRLNGLWSLGGAVLMAGVSVWGISFFVFTQGGWIPLVPGVLGLLASGAFVLAYKAIYRTYHDPLTGLPNRRLLIRQIQQVNRSQGSESQKLIAILFLDFDRFKTINDGLGHLAGDHLLMQISRRLQEQSQPQILVGRVGGDEFALCLNQISQAQEVTAFADALQKHLSQPFYWQNQEIYITASIGIALECVGQNFQAGELLRYADIAMYRAKELGTARHEVFVEGMDTQAVERWQLETDLRAGLQNQEFQLYYQPIISLKTGKIAGFEALVRWVSNKRGFVSPGDFIPLAEETGLIVPLGQWILQEACQQIQRWHEQFPQIVPLIMSVNLSGRQFTQPDLVKQIQKILDEVNIEGDRLKLEITESMMMNDVETAIDLLRRLKGLGLRLSIDDFGTGYSSLSYLHRFPVDTLKVDRSFVGRMEEGSDSEKYIQIVRTIISLGHNLDLDVIAEGIETEAQVRVLESLNCEYGQGYYFSKPLSAKDAEELLNQDKEW